MATRKRSNMRSITMWGAPATGKTTFLAALSIGLTRQANKWRIQGFDEASEAALIKMSAHLIRGGAFPAATVGINEHRWILTGWHQNATRQGRWLGKWPPGQIRERNDGIRMPFNIIDPAGDFASRLAAGRSAREYFLGRLTESDAIIFMYDPIREFVHGDTFDHTYSVLIDLARQMPRQPDGKLPHYVAVCVTKFDETRVLLTAESLDLLDYTEDEMEFPHVPDEDTREFLSALCEVSSSKTALTVLDLLERAFRPDRIRYFTTSATGFYVNPRTRKFDSDDPTNVLMGFDGGPARIRGAIYPLNVVEPVLWLCESLAEQPER